MDYYRYYPMLGVNFKFFHVVDSFSDAVTKWDPRYGLAAKDRITVPRNEKKFQQSITDHFQRSGKKSIYIPVVQRQHLKVEELKKRAEEKGEKILVLEIDVEKILPGAKIYTVRDIIAGREGPWVGDPREDEWKVTYLILHSVWFDAVTAYEPEEFLKKEREEMDRRHEALYNEVARNIGREYGGKKQSSWTEWVCRSQSGDKK